MMFNKLVFVCVFSCLSTSLMGMFECIEMKDYKLAQLIQARACWLGREDNIESLKEETGFCRAQFMQYHDGDEHVASISARNSVIRTHTNEEIISLSYAEFDIFIQDEKLREQAAQYRLLVSQKK